MPKAQKISEQINSLQEQHNEEVRVLNGGHIKGVEGGLRADIFEHDVNSEYDFSEDDCPVCELPEHAQDEIIHDMEQEDNAT